MNLSFLNTTFLYFLPLTFLPIIIHLFFKRKPKRVVFSDLRFIQLATKNVVPKKKLYQWLLLLVRCLIILLICFAFARPIGYIGVYGAKKSNQQILILIDASYSMQYSQAGKRKIDIAKEIGSALVELLLSERAVSLNPNRQIAVAMFSNRIEQYTGFTNDIKHLVTFINQAKPTFRTTEIISALEFSYDFMSDIEFDRTIIVISDMAAHGFGNIDDLRQQFSNYSPEVKLVFVDIGEEKYENAFLKEIKQNIADKFEIKAGNFSSLVQNRLISVYVNNKNVFENFIRIPPKSTEETVFEIDLLKDEEKILGSVNLQFDALQPDDIYYFVFYSEPKKKILVVDGDPQLGYSINSETYYLTAALHEELYGKISTDIVPPDKFETMQSIDMYDIVFMCNLDEISDKKNELLKKFANSTKEKLLFVFLGNKVNPDKYPDWLKENIVILQEKPSTVSLTAETQKNFPEIEKFELNKIIFKNFFQLNDTNALQLLTLRPIDHQERVQSPLLLQKNFSNCKLYIFASSADMDWSNFPSKSFYPYFVQSIIQKTTKPIEKLMFTVGETLKFAVPRAPKNKMVLLPNGEYKPVKVIPHLTETIIEFEDTELPGLYSFGDKTFAVNVERPKESNLDKVDKSKLVKLFSESPMKYIKFSKDILKEIIAAVEGKELSTEFFLAGIVLLGIEILLSNKKLKQ